MRRYSSTIRVLGDPERLFSCLLPESMEYDRSSFNVVKAEDGVTVEIEAKDVTAFRATLNSVVQLFTIYDGIDKL